MIKRFLTGIIILVAVLGFAVPAFAHVLKTDGSIGVLIHLDPEDDPIAGEPATFYFEFKDKDNKFDPTHCTCTVSIAQGGIKLFTAPIFSGSNANTITSPTFQYTFPTRGIYTLFIDGSPNNPAQFQNFHISYDIRVSRESTAVPALTNSSPPSHTLHYIIFGAGFIAIAIIFIQDKYKNKKSNQRQ